MVTATVTAPAAPDGVTAVIVVAFTTVKLPAATPPNVTPVVPVKSAPVMVTVVPPASPPDTGDRLDTVGTLANVKPFANVPVPPGVITTTSAAPADRTGVTAVIDVALTTVNEAAFVDPNRTAVAPVKPVPEIVTDVPPPVGPVPGEMDVTVGAST